MASLIKNHSAQEAAVRRLVRRKGSGEYFRDDGWTTNPDEARNFSDELEVMETCVRAGLSDVELILRLGSRTSDVFSTPML